MILMMTMKGVMILMMTLKGVGLKDGLKEHMSLIMMKMVMKYELFQKE